MFGFLFQKRPRATRHYRVVRCLGCYEPQFSYNAGTVEGLFWYPLNREGYWLEPDAFSKGDPTKRSIMSKEEAKRAVLRARAINQEHISRAVKNDLDKEKDRLRLLLAERDGFIVDQGLWPKFIEEYGEHKCHAQRAVGQQRDEPSP